MLSLVSSIVMATLIVKPGDCDVKSSARTLSKIDFESLTSFRLY